MTETTAAPAAEADHEPGVRDLSPAFRAWIDLARPRSQIWRTAVGGAAIVVIWLVWTGLLLLGGLVAGLVGRDSARVLLGGGSVQLSYTDTVVMSLILLGTFGGLWIGVWLVVRLLHKRRLTTVITAQGRMNWKQFGAGAAIGAGYLLVGLATSVVTGHAPYRTAVDFSAWLIGSLPIALFLLIQTSGEEVFFRGYLVQQLAARFRHPLVWALVPAIAFGLGHYANGGPSVVYSVYYVLATIMFAIISTVCLWRTGSLSASMGLHFINNIAAFLIVGPDSGGGGTTLWAWTSGDIVAGASYDLATLVLMLVFIMSPLAPLPRVQGFGRRNDTRAAP